jgi:hypothetical protein
MSGMPLSEELPHGLPPHELKFALVDSYIGAVGPYGDFTICPTQPYKEGHSQEVIVEWIENPRVVTLKK